MDPLIRNFYEGKKLLQKDFTIDAIWIDGYITTLRYLHKDDLVKIAGNRLEFSSLEALEAHYNGKIKDLRGIEYIE